jgi:hypothetical protein
MSFSRGPNISTNGLVFCIDYANEKSYPGYGSTVKSLMTVQGSSGLPSGTINSLGNTSGDQFITQGGGGINRTSASNPTRTTFSNIATTSHLSFFSGSFSLEAVFSPSGFADNTYFGLENVLISKGPFSTLNYLMQFNSTQLSFCKRSGSESLIFRDFNATFTSGSIYDCVITVSENITGNSANNVVKAYQNGVLLGSSSLSGNMIEPRPGTTETLQVPANGGSGDNTSMNFQGTYFVARIYNRVLSDEEVLFNYESIKGRF